MMDLMEVVQELDFMEDTMYKPVKQIINKHDTSKILKQFYRCWKTLEIVFVGNR